MSDERMNMTILGREIGTASGWDQSSDWGINYYDPIFNEIGQHIFNAANAQFCFVDLETGVWQLYNEVGFVISEGNDLAYRFARAELA